MRIQRLLVLVLVIVIDTNPKPWNRAMNADGIMFPFLSVFAAQEKLITCGGVDGYVDYVLYCAVL